MLAKPRELVTGPPTLEIQTRTMVSNKLNEELRSRAVRIVNSLLRFGARKHHRTRSYCKLCGRGLINVPRAGVVTRNKKTRRPLYSLPGIT